MLETTRASGDGQQSPTVLLKQLADQSRRLAQQELELAKAELASKAKDAGLAGGLLGAAGLVGLLALLSLTAALILALATALPGWLAAAIVGALYVAVAIILGVLGRARMAKATPLAPTQAIKSLKEDIAWLKTRVKYAKR